MSDKDVKGPQSLADLLRRGQRPSPPEPPPEDDAAAEDAVVAEAEAQVSAPTRLEVEVVDLEPEAETVAPGEPEPAAEIEPVMASAAPAAPAEAPPVSSEPISAAPEEPATPAAPPAAKRPPIIKPRTPFAERKPGWLSGAPGARSPVSGAAASEVFTKALVGEEPEPEPEPAPIPMSVAAQDAPVIDIKRVELTFDTNDGPVEALADINLTVHRGEFISLIGPSGCGKTTLLRVIADLEHVTSGTVLINGVTPEQARLARAYGYVFQAPALYPWRTIAKNVALPLEIMGLGVIEREDRIARNLELVNLTGFERKYPWQLSGGMQQRASIARALAVEPDLLLMDEPFGALDEIVRDHLNQQLLELWGETNKTVVFVTHSIQEAVFLSTRIVVMTPRPGKVHDIIDSTLPRNRNLDIRETPEFLRIAHRVRQGLRAGDSYED